MNIYRKGRNEKTFQCLFNSLAFFLQTVFYAVFRKIKDSDKYQLIAGERRYRACSTLNHENILCHVKECDDEQALDVMMEENLNRQTLKPLDEARKYQVLIWDKKYTVKDVAFRFGLKEQYVYSRLALLDLIPEIASLVEKDEINLSVANEIAKYSPELHKKIRNVQACKAICLSPLIFR